MRNAMGGRITGASNHDWRRDLLLSPKELLQAHASELEAGASINAYLLIVALNQLVDDTIEPSTSLLRIGDYLRTGPIPGSTIAAAGVRGVGRLQDLGRVSTRPTEDLRRWQDEMRRVIAEMAAVLFVEFHHGTHQVLPRVTTRVTDPTSGVLRRLGERTPVLPSCFETFDLSIADVFALGARVADRLGLPPACAQLTHTAKRSNGRPQREMIVVIGIRTSGSYLAPLLAQVMLGRGSDVVTLTIRPGAPLSPHARALVRRAVRSGARFVVTDDPPVTGSSFVRSIAQLSRLGVDRANLTVAFPRFIDTPKTLPDLDDVAHVTLDWRDWTVHDRLRDEEVRQTLTELLPNGSTVQTVKVTHQRRPRRAEAHVRSVYDVTFEGRPGVTTNIAVQGVGLGYYGEHVLVVADALREFAPQILGLRDGLLYREWFPDKNAVAGSVLAEGRLATGLARYAATRIDALAVERDASRGLRGSQPVWETAASEVSRAYGRAWPITQVLAANSLARKVLSVDRPAVIDGTTELENWFVDDEGSLRTVGLQGRAFWHHGLSSYDPVFDLAGATDAALDVPEERAILNAYAVATGDRVSPERWLLLRLTQLWGRRRRSPQSAAAVRAASSRALQSYMASVFLDFGKERNGARSDRSDRSTSFVALDVDGVLESESLGYPALTMASAFALRALRRHGHEPILATGRSLDEVKERCHAYGLLGGVAEYGSVLHVSRTRIDVDLRSDDDRCRIDALRSALLVIPGIEVDPRFRHAVRARTTTGPLSGQTLAALAPMLDGIRTIRGDAQSDFVADSVDKGTGLDALLSRLGEQTGPSVLSFAVGDTESDDPMLQRAACAAVPAHATAAPRWPRTSAPYQAGLLEAVDDFVGHPKRSVAGRLLITRFGCALCRMPRVPPEREALLLLLSGSEAGPFGMARRAARAARLSRR